ncbi:MAG TPA: caspase family protein, partial [Amaricoccus sp.]|nr:caspase family protein [Amaricoccus sp.]
MPMRAAAGTRAGALLVTALLALAGPASAAPVPGGLGEPAPKRFAIVVGNGDYLTAPDLGNARADALLVADFLAEEGYTVSRHTDLDKAGFEHMLQRILL